MNMPMPADSMRRMGHDMDSARDFLMRESSGTGFQPSAWPMPMVMTSVGHWRLMWMAQAFLVDTQQTGPLGADKFYSTNWGMLGAVHRLGGGDVMLRTMLSLEPATVSGEFYPLLFQTGETAYGRPIVNGQHPHDFVMELSVQYAHRLGEHAVWDLYYAPVGDPALGPVAYPHRASAMEIPQSTLGHHWEDSTHILYNVVTAGMSYKAVRLEASGFHGAEPDENRWNIDFGPMNSYSARLTVTPMARWLAQVSAGNLVNSEALEPGTIVRTTASVEYIVPRPHGNAWATTLLWGRNGKQAVHYGTNAVLAETVVPFKEKNFVSGRYEWSQRDELFANDPALAQQLFDANRQPLVRYQRVHDWLHARHRNFSQCGDGAWRECLALRFARCHQAVLRRTPGRRKCLSTVTAEREPVEAKTTADILISLNSEALRFVFS